MRGFSDLAEARAEAKRIANQLAIGENTAAAMRNTEAASYCRACELVRPTGTVLEVAAATYPKGFEILGSDRLIEAAIFYRRHGADSLTPRTVAEVVDELIESKKTRGKSARYIGDLHARLTRLAKAHVRYSARYVQPTYVSTYVRRFRRKAQERSKPLSMGLK